MKININIARKIGAPKISENLSDSIFLAKYLIEFKRRCTIW